MNLSFLFHTKRVTKLVLIFSVYIISFWVLVITQGFFMQFIFQRAIFRNSFFIPNLSLLEFFLIIWMLSNILYSHLDLSIMLECRIIIICQFFVFRSLSKFLVICGIVRISIVTTTCSRKDSCFNIGKGRWYFIIILFITLGWRSKRTKGNFRVL